MPWSNGVWVDCVTPEQKELGGVWPIGDKPISDALDYPGRVDTSLKVKVWCADVKKYGGDGYVPKARLPGEGWEYVRVFSGQLDCKLTTLQREYALEYPSEGVDLPPGEKFTHSWRLPQHVPAAIGITVIRALSDSPIQAGQGEGYELCCWDETSSASLDALEIPSCLESWRHKFVVPLVGGCRLSSHCGMVMHSLRSLDFAFIPQEANEAWTVEAGLRARGVVIYF